MLLTIFMAVILCAAASLLMFSAVAFIQEQSMLSSAPEEVKKLIQPREKELFPGARIIGWTLFLFALIMILGVFIIPGWDGHRNGFTFQQYFFRYLFIFTAYKLYDMIFFDYFLLLRFGFFQYYYPEAANVMTGRKYGFNIRSQLIKLLLVFPAIAALISWICTLIK